MLVLSKGDATHIKFHLSTVVLFAEMLRGAAALALVFATGNAHELRHFFVKDLLLFAVPALLYAINDEIAFECMDYMDSGTFQTLSNFKILTTALLCHFFLDHRIRKRQWFALALLSVGSFMGVLSNSFSSTGASIHKAEMHHHHHHHHHHFKPIKAGGGGGGEGSGGIGGIGGSRHGNGAGAAETAAMTAAAATLASAAASSVAGPAGLHNATTVGAVGGGGGGGGLDYEELMSGSESGPDELDMAVKEHRFFITKTGVALVLVYSIFSAIAAAYSEWLLRRQVAGTGADEAKGHGASAKAAAAAAAADEKKGDTTISVTANSTSTTTTTTNDNTNTNTSSVTTITTRDGREDEEKRHGRRTVGGGDADAAGGSIGVATAAGGGGTTGATGATGGGGGCTAAGNASDASSSLRIVVEPAIASPGDSAAGGGEKNRGARATTPGGRSSSSSGSSSSSRRVGGRIAEAAKASAAATASALLHRNHSGWRPRAHESLGLKMTRIYFWGCLFSIFHLGLELAFQYEMYGTRSYLTQGFNFYTWVLVCSQALMGLTLTTIIHQTGAISKLFLLSIAMIFSTMVTVVLFKLIPSFLFCLSLATVVFSVLLYNHYEFGAGGAGGGGASSAAGGGGAHQGGASAARVMLHATFQRGYAYIAATLVCFVVIGGLASLLSVQQHMALVDDVAAAASAAVDDDGVARR